MGVSDEDGEREALAVWQGDETDVVGGGIEAVVEAGGAGLVRDDRARWQKPLDAVWGAGGFGHPLLKQSRVLRVQRGVVREAAQQRDHGSGLGRVLVLEGLVVMQLAL